MPQTCTICAHPKKEEIEKSLLGSAQQSDVSRNFNVSRDALYRHKRNCMPKVIQSQISEASTVQAEQEEPTEERAGPFVWNLFAEMAWLHDEARAIYKLAKGTGDYSAASKALGEARQQMKLFSELLVGQEPGQAEKLETQWIAVREIFFEELEPYPEVRLAIARRLRALKGSHDHESDGLLFEAD
jgi:hypothetical protein